MQSATANMDRIRSTIVTGLQDHPREADTDTFYAAAESLVKSFEQASGVSIEDEGVYVTKVNVGLLTKDPEDNVSIAYSRRHSGLFPFPHDHCTVEFCWEATIDGKRQTVCIEIEYPCNVDWPIIGRL